MQFWIIYGGWGVVPVQSLSDELLEKKKKNNVHVRLAANCQNLACGLRCVPKLSDC